MNNAITINKFDKEKEEILTFKRSKPKNDIVFVRRCGFKSCHFILSALNNSE